MNTTQWVFIDGQRLTPAMAHDFNNLNQDFFNRTRCWLRISSGIRTDGEQERIWYDRMVLAHQVNGRRVYETRWWNGRLWYRISSAGTVAPPGQSNHQINLAAGRKGALDLYDTGSDAGILTRGSFRANVFDAIAPHYGYDSEGYAFGENWHKRYNRDPWRPVPSPTPPKPAPTPVPPKPLPIEEEEMKILFGHRKGTGSDEWMIVHPDLLGEDEKQKGYLVTTDPERAKAWARLYKNGWQTKLVGEGGRYDFDLERPDYIVTQEAARVTYDAKRRAGQ